MLPINMLLSYLWLATAIIANIRRQEACSEPTYKYACQKMKVAQAFSTIALYVPPLSIDMLRPQGAMILMVDY